MRFFVIAFFLFLLPAPASAESIYEEVNLAIERGVHAILKMQRQDGTFRIAPPGNTGQNAQYPMGVNALCVYALLKSGLSPQDPLINRAVGVLRYMPFRKTYSVAILVLALDAMHDKSVDPWIRKAGAWLESRMNPDAGIWGYPENHPDLSNTQYAALGLWMAERHGFKARKKTWIGLINGVMAHQNAWGGFGYREELKESRSSGAMTTAGIAAMTIALDALRDDTQFPSLKKRARKALARAWEHLDRCFTATGDFAGPNGVIKDRFPGNRSCCFHFYYLYGLERVAALEGRSRIGGRNWYEEGALNLLSAESDSGGWGDLVDTCFALLFLRRATYTGMEGHSPPSERPRAVYWRYTTEKPPAGWEKPGFEDSGWSRGAACLGSFGASGGAIRTIWKKPDIWMRRSFELREDPPADFSLFLLHDDSIEVYLDGVLAVKKGEWNKEYEKDAVSDAARAAMKKGTNLLAAHCHNIGGAQIVDVRLRDIGMLATRAGESREAARRRWWKAKPLPETPFIRRWLVLGPLANPDDALLLDPLKPDLGQVPPRKGTRTQGAVWKPYASPGPFLDFARATRPCEACLYCAAAWLKTTGKVRAVLWLGADDGLRVLVDNRVLLSHHAHSATPADTFRVPLNLDEGVHCLVVKVENRKGASGLYARISSTAGEPLANLRPVLDPDLPDWPAAAKAQPSLFSLDELLSLLPPDGRSRLDFDSEADMNRVAVGTSRPGYPRWLAKIRRKEDVLQPNPGARGIILLRPPSPKVPVRMIRKITVPPGRKTFFVRVSAEAHKAIGKSGCRVRLGVFDGSLEWIASANVFGGDKSSPANWTAVTGDVEEYEGREVLLIVECSADETGHEMDCAFIDEASLK